MATLLSTYYDCLISQAGVSFAYLIQTSERIEDGLKTSKIKDYQALSNKPQIIIVSHPKGSSWTRQSKATESKFTPFWGEPPKKILVFLVPPMSINRLLPMLLIPRGHSTHLLKQTTLTVNIKRPDQLRDIVSAP